MSLLPNAENAFVPDAKVRNFLLDPNNRDNNGRAFLFFALGYSPEKWPLLARDLLEHAHTHEAIEMPSNYGRRFRIVAILDGPIGSRPVRTIWEIPHGGDAPIFVTAYPGRRL